MIDAQGPPLPTGRNSGRFSVMAMNEGGPVEESRTYSASAIVLARRWSGLGYNDVAIITPEVRISRNVSACFAGS